MEKEPSQLTEEENKQRLLELREEQAFSYGVGGAAYDLLQEQVDHGPGGKIDPEAQELLELVRYSTYPDMIRNYCTSTLHSSDDTRKKFLFNAGLCLADAIENSLRIGRTLGRDISGNGPHLFSSWVELFNEKEKSRIEDNVK